MWPSAKLAEIVIRRLEQHHFVFSVEHLSYHDAGHLISVPYLPLTIRHSRHPVMKLDTVTAALLLLTPLARADSCPGC